MYAAVVAHEAREGEELNCLSPEARVILVAQLEAQSPELIGGDVHDLALAVELPADERIWFFHAADGAREGEERVDGPFQAGDGGDLVHRTHDGPERIGLLLGRLERDGGAGHAFGRDD